jgi:hypothetical protein
MPRMGQLALCMGKGTALGKRDTTLPHRHTLSVNYSSDRLLYNLLLNHSATFAMDKQFCRREGGRGDQEEHLVRDGGFFEGSWGQGFHQDEGSVRHVCGWIHSKRRNKFHQKLVEKLVHGHTNLVLRESLDDTLHHRLPGDIDLIIDDPVDESEEEPEV